MLASADLSGLDGTPYAQAAVVFLALVVLSAGIPAVRLWLGAGRQVGMGRRVGAVVLAAVAGAAGWGAGRLFVAANRGDYRPHAAGRAAARTACRAQAELWIANVRSGFWSENWWPYGGAPMRHRNYGPSGQAEFVDRCVNVSVDD